MKPILDWSAYKDAGMGDAYADIPKSGGNFARAVSVCINARQCEQKGKGVMCPSFRVTDNPAYATGGRVRLLKALLNGELSLEDRALTETMELCLACKGCKRECENEVDMAMIKIEYLAQRYLTHRPSLRTRLLARLPTLLSRHSILKSVVRLRNRSSAVAGLGQRLLGIDARVRLPEPAPSAYDQFSTVHALRESIALPAPVGEVAILLDTFTNRFAPEQMVAARQVLEHAGYRVDVVHAEAGEDALCCGRTCLAHGMVDDARSHAERLLMALAPHVEAGRVIIGLEPACLLALRDDYRFLGLGEVAEEVAAASLLFEEFLARESMAGRFQVEFLPYASPRPILIHGHCHQKAVGAMKAIRRIIKLVPGVKFEIIDSTCCGMAGSFGLEAEHAEAARAMAETGLLPALRRYPDSAIIANGFSCRHQIDHCEQRQGIHIATFLAGRLPTIVALPTQ